MCKKILKNLSTLCFSESPKFIWSWLESFTNTYSPCPFMVCVAELSSLSSHLSSLRTDLSSVNPLPYTALFFTSLIDISVLEAFAYQILCPFSLKLTVSANSVWPSMSLYEHNTMLCKCLCSIDQLVIISSAWCNLLFFTIIPST